MNIRKTLFLAGALSCAMSLTLVGAADASIKCRSAIDKTIAKYVQSYSKILQKCEAAVLKAGSGSCPDAKGISSIAKLDAKTAPAVAKQCAGADKTIGTADDATGYFTHGRCPDVEGVTADASNCSNIVVQDAADIAACANCVAAEQAQELTEAAYGGFTAAASGTPENKCQDAIGKATAAFFQAKSKAISKCRQGQFKGSITTTCDADQKTIDGINKAEDKKLAAIAKACSGPDGILGPENCQNAGATANAACATNLDCAVCSDDATACDTGLDCNVCTAGRVGDPCSANAHCNVCTAGNTGADCTNDASCSVCVGGGNPGFPCPNGVVACTGGGTCPNVVGSCPTVANSCAGGTIATCGGGDCRGDDDLTKAAIGYFAKCPLIVDTGVNTGPNVESLQDIIECVDATAATRIDCADAIGASSQTQNMPLACERSVPSCVGDQGSSTIAITLNSTVGNLGSVSVVLGYKDLNIPGSGELDPLTGPLVPTFFNGQLSIIDDGRQVLISIVAGDPVGDPVPGTGVLVNGSGGKCLSFTSADDVSCIVRDAVDTTGATILEGVTCTVSAS